MNQEHCWHPDEDSPESYDPWPARTGRQGVGCCSCPALGHRPITLTESRYEGFHQMAPPVFGVVTQTHGMATCSGADLRDERDAIWVANAIGYAMLVVMVALSVRLFWWTPDVVARSPVTGSMLLGAFYVWAYGYLRTGHKELRRVKAELVKNCVDRPADRCQVRLPDAPRFIVACADCATAEAILDTSRSMTVRWKDDRWVYTGVVCCGCGQSFTVEAIDNPNGAPKIELLGLNSPPFERSGPDLTA